MNYKPKAMCDLHDDYYDDYYEEICNQYSLRILE